MSSPIVTQDGTLTEQRYKELLDKLGRSGLTRAEKSELRDLEKPIPRKKVERKTWGAPGSKVSRKLPAKVWSAGQYRDVVFSLYPDGVIGMRLAKHSFKSEVHAMAGDIFRWASAKQTRAEHAKRKAERKARRSQA